MRLLVGAGRGQDTSASRGDRVRDGLGALSHGMVTASSIRGRGRDIGRGHRRTYRGNDFSTN